MNKNLKSALSLVYHLSHHAVLSSCWNSLQTFRCTPNSFVPVQLFWKLRGCFFDCSTFLSPWSQPCPQWHWIRVLSDKRDTSSNLKMLSVCYQQQKRKEFVVELLVVPQIHFSLLLGHMAAQLEITFPWRCGHRVRAEAMGELPGLGLKALGTWTSAFPFPVR